MAHWTLQSADPPARLDVDAGDNGPVTGTLTVGAATFPVSGSWAASFSVPGRNASAFSLSGSVSPAGSAATTFVAAAGIMDGPGTSPVQITIRVFVSSSGDGTMTSDDLVLLPVPAGPGSVGSRPGSLDSGHVNLASGDLLLGLPLLSLPGRGGLGTEVGIQYSSAVRSAATWNLEAPTGPLGLGWNLPGERVVRDTAGTGTVLDDRYYLFTEGGAYPLAYTGSDSDGEAYLSTNFVFWKIRYQPAFELWAVTKEDGTRWFFGGNQRTPAAASAAVEYTVARGNWIGASIAAGQQQLATTWNLAARQSPDGNQVSYRYEQDLDYVGAQDTPAGRFTVACRLAQITGANGETATFAYAPKTAAEYARWNDPPAGPAHAYQDRVDTRYLDSVTVADAAGQPLSKVTFRYALLGTGLLTKRLLKGVTRVSSTGVPLAPEDVFTYYGENAGDGVSVSLADASGVFNVAQGALWGALASWLTPAGALWTYRYASQVIDTARRELAIARPQNGSADWAAPQTYFGPDFAVVAWSGKAGTANSANAYLTAYQWQGRWIAADLGPIPRGNEVRVDVAGEFFAVVTPGAATAMRLYAKDPVVPGNWRPATPATTVGTSLAGAAGDRFYALMDTDSGRLYRFTLDGPQWHADVDEAAAGAGAVHAMGASGAVVFTACEDPNQTVPTQLRLYHLDRERDWKTTTWTVAPFCPKKTRGSFGATTVIESGIEQFTIQVGPAFAAVQSKHNTVTTAMSSVSNMAGFRHFIFRWGTDYSIAETREIGSEMPVLADGDGPRLTAAGDQVTIDGPGGLLVRNNKHVSVFDGGSWLDTSYTNDSLVNNYIAAQLFTATSNGSAQVYEFDPVRRQWNPEMDPFHDGNQTLWEKLWPLVYTAEGLLSFALGPEALVIDLLFLVLDRYISNIVDSGGAGRGTSRFFTGDTTVWHRGTDGAWTKLGDLAETYTNRQLQPVTFGWEREDQSLSQQSTQSAAEFIAFTVTLSRHLDLVINGVASSAEEPGFPRDTSRILLLRNGGFQGVPVDVPDGLVKYSGDPGETPLTGTNAFISYQGAARLADAAGLTLHRVIDGDFTGPLATYVVASERLDDGAGSSWTHFSYAGGEMHPSGETALFAQVTQTFSGGSAVPATGNGVAENHFYTGLPGTPANAPADAGNAAAYPALMRGLRYYTRVLDGSGAEVASTTQAWQATESPVTGNRTGCWVRPVRTVSTVSGHVHQVDRVFDPTGRGFVTRETVTNRTLAMADEAVVTTYRYACQLYPAMLALNIVNEVAQTTVTVNGSVTDATATTFQPWPAPAVPGSPAWPGPAVTAWGPAASYRVLRPDAGSFDPQHIDPAAWQLTRQVTARARGVVSETRDLDGVSASVVFDTAYRVPVASFTNASVSGHEAGYLGFESYEDTTRWQLSGGTAQPGGNTGASSFAGPAARVTAGAFSPRAGVAYVVSAWVRPRPGGAGARIGFGSQFQAVPAGVAMRPVGPWQYAEFVQPSPLAAQPPFVLCDGAIDNVRFAPVDAGFTAAVYDPSRLLVRSTLHTNGEVLRCVRDERQRVVAELGPGGQVAHFDGWTFARDAMSDGLKSNTMLSVTAAGGGTYRDSLPLMPAGTAVTLFAASPPVTGFDVAGRGWCARFEVVWSANDGGMGDGNQTVLRLDWGAVRLDISYTSYDLSVNGSAVVGQAAPGLPGLLADVMVMAVGGTVLVFQGNQLVFSQPVTGGSGPVTLTMQGRGLDLGRVDDVYLLRDPIVAAVISDGLGREVQRITQDDGATGSVVSATFYDGWGRPAVRTLPVHVQPASFAGRPDLFTGYDWATGRLSGGVQAFYNGAGQVPSQLGDDASFAATRSLAEASPLARPAETAPPGAAYAPGRPAVTSWAYGPAVPDAALLAQDLGLAPAGAFGFATAYLPTAAGPGRVPEVRVFDRQGNTIVTRRRSDAGKLTTGHAADRAPDGTLRLTTLTPNHYLNPGAPGYTTVTTTDFTGRAISVQDTDTGLTQMIYDRGGRLRFLLDADGAAQTPPRLTYRKYDGAGRPVEDGWIGTPWDRAHLQAIADTQPGWPGDDVLNAGPPGHPVGQWSTRQHWDIVPGTASSARLKGRLAQVAAQDENGHQVVETYAYDAYGRTSSVTLQVQSFDAIARTTAYRYNLAGDVTQITYPAADGTPTGPAVSYGYDSLGRPATIGTAGAPALYAAYDYTFDGKVRTEWLGGRSIRGDIGYDFQGRRLSASYQLNGAALFAETLEFSATSGDDPVAVTARGGVGEVPYRYAIGYDPQARLGSAETTPDPGSGLAAHPEWDVTGPVGYDGNGNIASLGYGSSPYRYDYDAGTDKLAARVPQNGGPAGNYRWDASGRLAGSPAISEIAYRPASALPSRISTQQGTTVFRYSGTRRRALKAPQGAEPQGKLYVHGAGAHPLLEQRGGISTQYVHGPGGLVAAVRGGTVYAVVRDALGSTRVLVPPGAADGSTLRFNYLPFGELMPGNAAPPAASPVPYLFTGRELDTESGLYDFRARLHDPVTGRFTAPDPAGEFASPYVYVGNDPFSRTDPSGQLSLGAYRILVGAATVAVYGAIGAGIGAGIGALADPQDRLRGAQEGAWIGAAAGAGLGLLRGIGEHVVMPLWRNRAAEAARAAAGTFPVVAYNATQWTSGFQSGRLGAELIAEAQGIPRSLRNTHLVSFQDLHAGGALHAPAGFNGRVIAVAHGPQGLAAIEVGLPHLAGGRADAQQFVDLFDRGIKHGQPAYSYAGLGHINQLDLCVCYPRSNGFSPALRAEFGGRVGWVETTGWAAAGATTPVGAWAAHGVIRETGSLPSEILHWLVPFYRPGNPMPAGVPPAGVVPAALGWGAI